MNDEVKHTPIERCGCAWPHLLSVTPGGQVASIGIEGDPDPQNEIVASRMVEAWNNYDRLREVNADLLAALEALMPMGEALLRVGRSFRDRQPWMDEQEKEVELSLLRARAAIACARGQ